MGLHGSLHVGCVLGSRHLSASKSYSENHICRTLATNLVSNTMTSIHSIPWNKAIGDADSHIAPPDIYNLPAKERALHWNTRRLQELRGTTLEKYFPDTGYSRVLCSVCQDLLMKLRIEADQQHHRSYHGQARAATVYLDNARNLPASAESCCICALFLFTLTRLLPAHRQVIKDSFAEAPLLIRGVEFPLVGFQIGVVWAKPDSVYSHGLLYDWSAPILAAMAGASSGQLLFCS